MNQYILIGGCLPFQLFLSALASQYVDLYDIFTVLNSRILIFFLLLLRLSFLQVTNFYAVSSRYGTPEDFKQLVDEAHGYFKFLPLNSNFDRCFSSVISRVI